MEEPCTASRCKGVSDLTPWASGGRGSRGIRLFPGTLADLQAVDVVVEAVVEFAVIELASAIAGAIAAFADG